MAIGPADPWGWVPPEWQGGPAVPEPDIFDQAATFEASQAADEVAGGDSPVWPPPGWGPATAPELPPPRDPPQVKLGMPRPVDRPVLDEGVDESLIGAYEEPDEGDFSKVMTSAGEVETTRGVRTSEQPLDPYADAGGGETVNPYALDTDVEALADLDPEAYASIVETKKLHDESIRSKKALEESNRQLALMEQNVLNREVARQKAKSDLETINTRATELADGSPFERWWSSRSDGQKFAGYLSAILGGFLLPKTGGRNAGIDFMTKLAEDDAAAKWKALGESRTLAEGALADATQDYNEREAIRLASYEQVARGLEAELSNLDPEGTAALRIAAAIRGVRGQMAQLQASQEKEAFDRADKMIGREIEAAKAQSEIDKRSAEIAKLNRAGKGTGKEKYTPEQLKVRYPNAPVPPAGTAPMTDAQYSQWLETSGKGKRLSDPSEAEKAERDRAIGDPRTGKPLLKEDGTVWTPGPDAAPLVRKQIASAQRIVDIIDEIDSIRDRVGGESSAFNSDDRQRLDSLRDEIVIIRKSGTEGMSSDSDMARIAASLGADDVASFRAQAAGLKQGRANTIKALNGALKSALYDGKPISFANKYKSKAQDTPDQREAKRIAGTTTGEKGQVVPTFAVGSPLGAGARVLESAIRSEDADAKLPEDDRNQIDSWGKDAAGNDPALARAARSSLQVVVDGRSPAAAKYAKKKLADAKVADVERKLAGKKPGSPGFAAALRKAIADEEDTDTLDEEDAE